MRLENSQATRSPAPSAGASGSAKHFVAHGRLIDASRFTQTELKAARQIGSIMEEGERTGSALHRKKFFMIGSSTARRLADLGHAGLEPIAEMAGERAVFAHLTQEMPDFKTAMETIDALGIKPRSVLDAFSEAVRFFHENRQHEKASDVWKRGILLVEEKL